jgi:peptidoglycan/xylan/chitin deacetylase (PgdA/CDA1 family)
MMNAVLALFAAVALGAPPAAAPPRPALTRDFRVPVLMYHRVAVLTPPASRNALQRDLTVSPTEFAQQVRYLASHGFTFVSTADIERAVRTHGAMPAKAVALTFDDGYRDNHDRAFPILQKYHATATVFVVTRKVGKPGHLTWKQVGEMQRSGIRFGSHTATHSELARLKPPEMNRELAESRRTLTARLREPETTLAYPCGSFNATVIARAKSNGYAAAWRKEGGPVTPDANPYRLPRVRISGRLSLRAFATIVERACRQAKPLARHDRARALCDGHSPRS